MTSNLRRARSKSAPTVTVRLTFRQSEITIHSRPEINGVKLKSRWRHRCAVTAGLTIARPRAFRKICNRIITLTYARPT